MDIYFVDNGRQDEIETFYEACQRHRDYYRGYPKAHHPLVCFKDPEYMYQCPSEMTPFQSDRRRKETRLASRVSLRRGKLSIRAIARAYLSFPMFHVKYKQPAVLPSERGRSSGLPALPARTLAGRFNKAACKAFVR